MPRWARIEARCAYARAALPVYWIVNLVHDCVEVYTEPSGPVDNPDYRRRQDYSCGASPGRARTAATRPLAVGDLLPER